MERMSEDLSGLINPRNTATLSLDGADSEVRENHLRFIGYFRQWCYSKGFRKDVSHLFDRQCVLYTTILNATFYPAITYQGKTLIFQIDGRNLYLKGFTGPNGSFQLDFENQKEFYMLQRQCQSLGFLSNYYSLVGRAGLTPTGLYELRKAFLSLYAYIGKGAHTGKNQLKPSPRVSIAIFIVYLCEPVRLQISLDSVSLSLTNASISKIDKVDFLEAWITNWRSFSNQIIQHVDKLCKGEVPNAIDNNGIKSICTIEDIIREVRVLYVDADEVGFFAKSKPAVHYPVFASPVDPGVGDKDVLLPLFPLREVCAQDSCNRKELGRKGKKRAEKRAKYVPNLCDPQELARRKFYRSGGVGGTTYGFAKYHINPLIIRRIPSPFASGEKRQFSQLAARKVIEMTAPTVTPFASGQKRQFSQLAARKKIEMTAPTVTHMQGKAHCLMKKAAQPRLWSILLGMIKHIRR